MVYYQVFRNGHLVDNFESVDQEPTVPTWAGQDWSLTDKGFEIFKSVLKEDTGIDVKFSHHATNQDSRNDINKKVLKLDPSYNAQPISSQIEQSKYLRRLGPSHLNLLTPATEAFPDVFQMVSPSYFTYQVLLYYKISSKSN